MSVTGSALLVFSIPVLLLSQASTPAIQKGGDCVINISGTGNTATLVCSGLDKAIAEQLRAILNRTRKNEVAVKELSAKLGDILSEQFQLATESVAANKMTAEAARDAAETARSSAVRNQSAFESSTRAYLLPAYMRILTPLPWQAGNNIRVQVDFRNTGRSPALQFNTGLVFLWKPLPLKPLDEKAPAAVNRWGPVANDSTSAITTGFTLDSGAIAAVNGGNYALVVLGTVTYVDFFEAEHTITFCSFCHKQSAEMPGSDLYALSNCPVDVFTPEFR